MFSVLIVIQLLISLALIGTILLQRSEGGALGMGGGGGGGGLGSLFSPRGAADTLTRTTAILAILFFANSLALTVLSLHGRAPATVIESAPSGPALNLQPSKPVQPAPAKPQPAVPTPH